MLGYSLPTVSLSSASPSVTRRARWHFGLIFRSRGDSLRAMKPESSSYLRHTDPASAHSLLVAAALSLFLVLVFAADAWARSSGGRYGGRAGFSQSRSGSSGGGWSSSRPAPTRPYSAPPHRVILHRAPTYVESRIRLLAFFLPFLWVGRRRWGRCGAGGGFGFGGILGLLIILGIVVLVGRVLLQKSRRGPP